MSEDYKVHRIGSSPVAQALNAAKATAKKAMKGKVIQQKATEKALLTKAAFHVPAGAKKVMKPLRQRMLERSSQLTKKSQEEMKYTVSREMESAADFSGRKNPEMNSQTLLILRGRLKETDTYEDILQKVLDMYPDYTLADDALDYLLETTKGALHEAVRQAKDELNARFHREIVAGRNISEQAREFSEAGLGSPTALRDMYRDITGNPREVHDLFEELSRLFDYDKMKTASNFLFHSLGADLKSKGPSISRAELTRLVEDTRSLQAILGVFLFFKERMKLIYSQFTNLDLDYPEALTFEILAENFMQLIKERYISSDQVKKLAKKLGISHEVLAQIIIFTQMRDAIRGVSPRLYRDNRHRREALEAILEALEDLEEEAEDGEEE